MKAPSTPLEIKLYDALRRITRYDSPDKLKRTSWTAWGCDPAEAMEMSYENIQVEAKRAIYNVRIRRPKT